MNKASTLLLTGATGHIGQHLRDYFEILGVSVIAPTREERDLSVNGSAQKYVDNLIAQKIKLDYIVCNAADQAISKLADADSSASYSNHVSFKTFLRSIELCMKN